jgi:hypothetical protein
MVRIIFTHSLARWSAGAVRVLVACGLCRAVAVRWLLVARLIDARPRQPCGAS